MVEPVKVAEAVVRGCVGLFMSRLFVPAEAVAVLYCSNFCSSITV